MGNDERLRKPKNLEGLGFILGKNMHMEIRGGTPVISGRNEIGLDGVVVDYDDDTVTIKIPRVNLTTLSEKPILPEEKSQCGTEQS